LSRQVSSVEEENRSLSRQVSQLSGYSLDEPEYAELERSVNRTFETAEESYASLPAWNVPEPDQVRMYQQQVIDEAVGIINRRIPTPGQGQLTVSDENRFFQAQNFRDEYLRERFGIPSGLVPIPTPVTQSLNRGLIPNQDQPNLGLEFLKIKIESLHPVRQKRYTDLFNSLNNFIGDTVRARAYLDTNYLFGQIQSEFGDVFDQQITSMFLVPVLEKIEGYNNSGFGMIGYNPVDLRFPIVVPEGAKKLYTPPPQNALPGTNNEIIFENVPDGTEYSQFMGKYGNIKHPETPIVELQCDKKVISGKYVCSQKVDGKLKSRRFNDIFQAKGWAIRGGFYADKIEKMRQTKIQGRYDNKFRVIPTIVR
jgi:hypothetical protein